MATIGFSGGAALEARLKEIAKRAGEAGTLQVGFMAGSTYPDGTSVPMVAAIQNYGAPAAGIPPRPFFTNMVRDKSPTWAESLGNIAVATDYDMKMTLGHLGEGIGGQLIESIIGFDSVPLADSTVARKGFDKQLVNTGHMKNSVYYKVGDDDQKHVEP